MSSVWMPPAKPPATKTATNSANAPKTPTGVAAEAPPPATTTESDARGSATHSHRLNVQNYADIGLDALNKRDYESVRQAFERIKESVRMGMP